MFYCEKLDRELTDEEADGAIKSVMRFLYLINISDAPVEQHVPSEMT